MFSVTCLIKTDIDTVKKCMGQNPYNPETFLQNFAARLTSFDDPLLDMYPTSEIDGNIEDENVILGIREPQKLVEWAKTMKERTQCMAMAEFSAALQKHKAEGIDDCPTLKRFSTNQKVLSVNGFGVAVPLFESPLVDTSYIDTVIADDIEDKEIEGLRKHLNPDGVISQLLNNVQKARAEKEIDEVESRVKQVETQIRLFLRTPEIENEIKDIETAHLNEEGGFDCGFIFWYPKVDSQLEKDMSLLVGANKRKLSWLDIAVPTFSQSINIQRYCAEIVKKLVKERLGIELYYRSELD